MDISSFVTDSRKWEPRTNAAKTNVASFAIDCRNGEKNEC